MKGRLISFAAGFAAATVFAGSSLTALAAEGALTIRAVPAELLVNGELFHPKDVNGKDAMVFTCNGTTYAPARALAEAYGLSVGYDPERKIATVNKSQTGSVASSDTAAGGACVPRCRGPGGFTRGGKLLRWVLLCQMIPESTKSPFH